MGELKGSRPLTIVSTYYHIHTSPEFMGGYAQITQ